MTCFFPLYRPFLTASSNTKKSARSQIKSDKTSTSSMVSHSQPPCISYDLRLPPLSIGSLKVSKECICNCRLVQVLYSLINWVSHANIDALHTLLGESWNCVVGKNFGSHVIHQTEGYLFCSYRDEISILLWKSGWTMKYTHTLLGYLFRHSKTYELLSRALLDVCLLGSAMAFLDLIDLSEELL